MSFLRSSMYTKPCASMRPMSPVRSQSPNHHLGGLVGPVPVAAHHLRTAHADLADLADARAPRRRRRGCEMSVEGIGSPIEPLKSSPMGLMQAAGEVSVRPQAWVRMQPVTFFQRSATDALHRHAAAQGDAQGGEVEPSRTRGVQQRVEQRVDAADEEEADFLSSATNAREVARIGDQDVVRPEAHEQQAVRGEREDVVQRQRGDHHPPMPVALERAGRIQALACSTFATMLRCVSIAALATPVVPPVYCRKAMSCGPTPTGCELQCRALSASALLKAMRPACSRRGTCLRTWRSTKFTSAPRGKPEQVADARHQHLLDARSSAAPAAARARNSPASTMALRARVLQLMLEFARRVQRVDVDDRSCPRAARRTARSDIAGRSAS